MDQKISRQEMTCLPYFSVLARGLVLSLFLLLSVFFVCKVLSMTIKQITNPLLVTGQPLTGSVRLRQNPKWSSLLWTISTLDNTAETSAWFSGAGIATSKGLTTGWFQSTIRSYFDAKSKARYATWGYSDRWGYIKGIEHGAAIEISDFIIRTWNEIIDARNRERGII